MELWRSVRLTVLNGSVSKIILRHRAHVSQLINGPTLKIGILVLTRWFLIRRLYALMLGTMVRELAVSQLLSTTLLYPIFLGD